MNILMLAKINSSHTKKWALALKKEGIHIALFSLHLPDENDDWHTQLDAVFFPGKDITSGGILSKAGYISAFLQLKKIIASFRPDIVHSHFATHYSFFGNISGFKKHIVTLWGSDVFVFPKKRWLNRVIFRYNLQKANMIISTSHAMAVEASLYTIKKIQVIPFGIDLSAFKAQQPVQMQNQQEIVIGNIKSLEPIYGIDVLIKAFCIVRKKLPFHRLKLVIVGKGSKLQEYMQLAGELGLNSDIIFTGSVSPEEVPGILNTFNIFACLSRNESFGVSVIEAMACKVPVVVTKTPGFREVVDNDNNGLFVDIEDPEDAAEKIISILNDETLRTSLTKNAYTRVSTHYDLKQNITQQIDLYKSMLSWALSKGKA